MHDINRLCDSLNVVIQRGKSPLFRIMPFLILILVSCIFIYPVNANILNIPFSESKINSTRLNTSSVVKFSDSDFIAIDDTHKILSSIRCTQPVTTNKDYGEQNGKYYSTFSYSSLASGCSNALFYNYIDLGAQYYTYSGTVFNFTFNTSASSMPILLYLIDENKQVTLLMGGNTTPSNFGDCALSELEYTYNSLPNKCYNNQQGYVSANTPTTVTFKISDLKIVVNGTTKPLPYNRAFRYLAFTTVRSLSGTYYLQLSNLSISNYATESNQLPNITFTADNYNACIPENESSVQVFFNVTSKDAEGDAVYYSQSNYEIFKTPYNYFNDFYYFQGDKCYLDKTFFTGKNFATNSSYVSQLDAFSRLALASIASGQDDILYMNYDIGNMTGACNGKISVYDGVNSFSVNPTTPLAFDSKSIYVLGFPIKTVDMSLIVRDNNYNQIINYSFSGDGTNISYYVDGIRKYNALYSTSDLFSLIIDANKSISRIDDTLKINGNSAYSGFTLKTFNEIYYNSFETANKPINYYWDLKTVSYSGFSEKTLPIFSSEIPNNATFTNKGINIITIYYSDSLHKDIGEFGKLDVNYVVSGCADFVNKGIDENKANALGSVKTGLNNICKSTENNNLFLRGFSTCALFMVIAVGVGIFFFIVGWVIFHNIVTGFLIYSASILAESLFVPMTIDFIIIHGFIFVIALAFLISGTVSGDGNQGGTIQK